METSKRNKIISLIILTIVFIAFIVSMLYLNYKDNKYKYIQDHRDLAYEYYCDSIWVYNPDYYEAVLMETDKYQQYIKTYGEWWHE